MGTTQQDARDFVYHGGLRVLERNAIKALRAEWIPLMQAWREMLPKGPVRSRIVSDLRRCGVGLTGAEKRTATRLRVRKHRERARQP